MLSSHGAAGSVGAVLNEPTPLARPQTAANEAPNFPVNFLTTSLVVILKNDLFSSHTPANSVYGPLYLAPSNMALPLHRQIKSFSTNRALSGPWALLPRDGMGPF